MKTILIMPAIDDHINVINLAKEQGYRVITCDNVPTNAGHHFAHKSYNIDLFDYAGLVAMAKKEAVDAVWGYATDIGALAAAKVSDALCLGGNSFEVVNTMCDKFLFRQFLTANNFNVPKFISVESEPSDVSKILSLPIIVKPIDRASSKGIRVVRYVSDFSSAFHYALEASICKRVVVEEFIDCDGHQLHGDVVVEDGIITCFGIGDHIFTYAHNKVASTGTIFPTSHTQNTIDKLKADVQHFVDLIGFSTGAINVEARLHGGKLFLIELGPRSGGNYTPELLSYIYQRNLPTDLLSILMGTKSVLNDISNKVPMGLFILRAPIDGILKGLKIYPHFEILERYNLKEYGDFVSEDSGPNNIIFILIIRCASMQALVDVFDNPFKYIDVTIH